MEKAVIGLDLCPFAARAYRGGGVRIVVSAAHTAEEVLADLHAELLYLSEHAAADCETTLLVHPHALQDFLEFNDFLAICDAAVAAAGLEGELQVASFHPQYQFADTEPADIANYTNRSPYPMLHVLREASVAAAVASVEDTDSIYLNNIERLRRLGLAGWNALWVS